MYLTRIKKSLKKILVTKGNEHFGNCNYGKFVVITRSRTGSNMLIKLISSHRSIQAYGELFNQTKDKNCEKIWTHTFSKRLNYVKFVGFKIFYDHPLGSDDKTVWDFIKSDRSIKIIHLKRENVIRSQLSLLIAHKTQTWGVTPTMKDTPIDQKKIAVNIEEFLKDIRKTKLWEKDTALIFSEHPYMEVMYKDIITDKDKTMEKIFKFLEVPDQKTTSDLRKQNPEEIRDLVYNYNELESALRNTEFYHLLKE
ncbi:sulfotransferase domain-containing protein [Salinimicrobium sp. GXAS 041]|uniref:sulfotransferase domain-containing protein n=1 Tax=Salinimicrobium sp. GXAS 041 TaxID=3400806 RepID=UPI003C78C45E